MTRLPLFAVVVGVSAVAGLAGRSEAQFTLTDPGWQVAKQPFFVGDVFTYTDDPNHVTIQGGYIFGGGEGQPSPGATDWYITVPADGTIHFGWSYGVAVGNTADPDGNGFGYWISDHLPDPGTEAFFPNGTQLSSSAQFSGTVSVPVLAGQIFGFRVVSQPIEGEGFPGAALVDIYGIAPVPEPASVMGLAGAVAVAAALVRRRFAGRTAVSAAA
jgi:hypothetical protein